jgi:thioester reductase-like protein
LRVEGSPSSREIHSILLTGATGFLGSRVLVELIDRTDATITCLVREPTRLIPALRQIQGERAIAAMTSRLRVITGDLVEPQLGLHDALYTQLAVDTIVHCAADVSLAKPYASLRPANVAGTQRVLELAARTHARVHHASTLGVFVGSDRTPGMLHESDALETAERIHGGYAQSKWAAEWLAREAGATIYRFGLLTGDTRTGRAPPRDWLTWFLRGLAQLGAAPRIGELRVDITPIDHAAAAFASLILDGSDGTFHIANRTSATLADLVRALRRAVTLEEVALDDWPSIVAAAELAAPEAAAAVLGLCRGADSYARVRACDVFQASAHSFDTTRVDNAFGTCPPPDDDLLDRYVAFALGVQ